MSCSFISRFRIHQVASYVCARGLSSGHRLQQRCERECTATMPFIMPIPQPPKDVKRAPLVEKGGMRKSVLHACPHQWVLRVLCVCHVNGTRKRPEGNQLEWRDSSRADLSPRLSAHSDHVPVLANLVAVLLHNMLLVAQVLRVGLQQWLAAVVEELQGDIERLHLETHIAPQCYALVWLSSRPLAHEWPWQLLRAARTHSNRTQVASKKPKNLEFASSDAESTETCTRS